MIAWITIIVASIALQVVSLGMMKMMIMVMKYHRSIRCISHKYHRNILCISSSAWITIIVASVALQVVSNVPFDFYIRRTDDNDDDDNGDDDEDDYEEDDRVLQGNL